VSGEWPDPSHVCAGSGEPILDAWTHGCIRRSPGATADEIIELVLNIGEAGGNPWPAYDRRMTAIRVREIMAGSRRFTGARRIVTIERVHEAEAALKKAAQPLGE
jgi:hypothetical protein